jgi:adenylosuccinate synthase
MKFEPDNDPNLIEIGQLGHEYGATTGRKRQCNYLNLDSLKNALEINQCNICIINKVDIIEQLKIFKLYHKGELIEFKSIDEMKEYIITTLDFIYKIKFSSNPYSI